MNAYEWKQEARRQRLERAADRAKGESETAFRSAHQAVDGIPFGQPILVGHHSEKRHRRALQRHDDRMRRGFGRLQEAQELARRAEAVGTGGISSDDPDGIAKLQEKLAGLEAQRERVKQINAAWRKAKGVPGWTEGLNLTEREASEIAGNLKCWGTAYNGVPFPPYVLTNLGARIRDAKKRVGELGQLAARVADGPTEAQVNGVGVLIDPADNRVTITFPRRLSREEYKQVRSRGFLWSPTRNGFTRKLNNGAEYIARMLAEQFAVIP